ncbi:MAG: radical SAM family heme chaperone HemW [Lentisphaerales bacterium]|nr:radical SAM family heme chaperone HemW [Lentisphaerales bacterium]
MLQSSAPYHSLYIHVPFCKNICDYCDLYSIVNNENSSRNAYLKKIAVGLQQNSPRLQQLQSIFIGGGTPSQLTPNEMKVFFKSINDYTSFGTDCEFSVECNPVSISPEKLQILNESGVNRLSFGAQSTTRKTRHTLGRRTSRSQLETALENAQEQGFKNINIDLIYGIPGQTLEDWQEDLKVALSYDLPHYSAYSLILEEDTALSKRYDSVDDELAVDMYNLTEEMLSNQKLIRYEISNYANPGKHCRHNYDIWKGASYLGLGPAAASFDGTTRWTQIRDLEKWLANEAPDVDELPSKERIGEILSFGFRTVNGWRKEELTNLLGHDALRLFKDTFEQLLQDELLQLTDNSYKPTKNGLLFADTIAESFIFC